MKSLVSGALVLFVIPTVFGQPDPTSPTTAWSPVQYDGANSTDPSYDQQTGSEESDFVGNLSEPSFYWQYVDGYLGFRVRLGADDSAPGFKGDAFVGLDANLNGAPNLFVGVDNQGSHNQLEICLPGSGLNLSPNTTTIANAPIYTYAETALDYSFTAVTAANDPGATSFDLNGDGKTDQFLTFYVPFADIAAALAAESINFATNSLASLIAVTATQPNSFNEDLNGVNGGINSSQTWSQLGAISDPISPAGSNSVPEPSPLLLFGLAGVAILLVQMRRRVRH